MILFKCKSKFVAGEEILVEDNPLAYVGIYKVLRIQILSGEYQKGEKLPSRTVLSALFHTSGKTIRRVVDILCSEGLIERREKAAPRIIYDPTQQADNERYSNADYLTKYAQQSELRNMLDIMDSATLIGAAVVQQALAICAAEGSKRLLNDLEAILDKMSDDEQNIGPFWRLSTLFWKRIIAQLNNAYILNLLVRLGYFWIAPRPNTQASRQAYQQCLKSILLRLRQGNGAITMKYLFFAQQYLRGEDFMGQAVLYPLKPSFFDDIKGIESYMAQTERYTKRIYLDLLGHIYMGDYRAGDFLPSHEELCQNYGVSHKTTTQAVKVLQEMGVVKSIRGHGIQMQISSEDLRKQKIELAEMIKRLRRILDQLQLAAITIESIIHYALEPIAQEEAQQIYHRLQMRTQGAFMDRPDCLLKSICAHIRYPILKAFYQNAMGDVAKGAMVGYSKEPTDELVELNQMALDAAALLSQGQQAVFGQKMAQLMDRAYKQLSKNIWQAGYGEAVMTVYTQESLYQSEMLIT